MKLNRKSSLLLVALASVCVGVAVAAAAETNSTPPPAPAGTHWHHHEGSLIVGTLLRATRQLNLTADQQQSIKGILTTARTQQKATAEANPVDLTVLANPGDPNYATAVQTAKTRAADRVQRESDVESQIYNVLTPEQKAKLPQVLADLKAKFEERRAAWQQQHAAGATGAASSSGATGAN